MVLQCICGGDGGIAEMKKHVADDMVMWGLLRFTTGEGAFERNKFIFLHLNGEKTPILARGRDNGRKDEVWREMGDVHASLEFTLSEELSLDNLCDRLLPLFVNDDGNERYEGIKAMHAAYEKMLARNRRTRFMTIPSFEGIPDLPSFGECMKRISSGNLNWLLVYPMESRNGDPRMHSAGFQSVPELCRHLDSKLVLYGLVRMGFGQSKRLKRNKYILIHWIGEEVGAVRRGRWNESMGTVKALFQKAAVVSCDIRATERDDLDVEKIIEKVRNCAVVDNEEVDDFTLDSFFEALDEETESMMQPVALDSNISVRDAVSKVRGDSSIKGYLWDLFPLEILLALQI